MAMKKLELGVFIPIANNGWIVSKNAPQYMATFDLNRRISELAERFGFEFVFSMSKWRGYGGETRFWDFSLESIALMAGLAAVTRRVKVYASVQPLMFSPAVAAKMGATIDDISGGRFGFNIVTGGWLDEAGQMGLVPPGYNSYRYEYAEEWVGLVKRLWTEESVTHHGRFLHLDDCRSDPKPLQKPHPDIVCAGISEEGMRFTSRQGTHSFLGGRTLDELGILSQRMKSMAKELGRQVKTYTVFTLIQGEGDAQAQETLDRLHSGADTEALDNIVSAMSYRPSGVLVQDLARQFVFYGCQPLAGGPETIASIMAQVTHEGDLDGIMFCFPDFIEGLNSFHRDVTPLLETKYRLR
jgi:pyrimidine oxygenase